MVMERYHITKRKSRKSLGTYGIAFLAEAVRFELTNGCPLPVFKTGAIDHSATPPEFWKSFELPY